MVSTRATVQSKPVVRRRLHESVVQQIAAQILGGDLPAGAALPAEPELAQQFGVSRITIREAVRVLASKGLVVVKHGSGTQIRAVEHWDQFDPIVLFGRASVGHDETILRELIELRRAVEVEAAGLAAWRRTDEELGTLTHILRDMRTSLAETDTYTALDTAFHDTVLTAGRNRLLEHALRPVSRALAAGRLLTVLHSRVPMEDGFRSHQAIYTAIEKGDDELARVAMRRHMALFESEVWACVQEGFTLDTMFSGGSLDS